MESKCSPVNSDQIQEQPAFTKQRKYEAEGREVPGLWQNTDVQAHYHLELNLLFALKCFQKFLNTLDST